MELITGHTTSWSEGRQDLLHASTNTMLKTIPTIGEQPWIKLTVEWKMKMKVKIKIKIKTKNAKENVNDDGKKQMKMQIKVAEPPRIPYYTAMSCLSA